MIEKQERNTNNYAKILTTTGFEQIPHLSIFYPHNFTQIRYINHKNSFILMFFSIKATPRNRHEGGGMEDGAGWGPRGDHRRQSCQQNYLLFKNYFVGIILYCTNFQRKTYLC